MTNYVAGHVDDVESMDSCIGIEFDPINGAVAYINEEEIGLTYKQVKQLEYMVSQIVMKMEWAQATWVYAHYSTMKKYHLMEKGTHGEREKTLCGTLPPTWGTYTSTWNLSPVLEAPWRTSSMCKRCLAIYDKKIARMATQEVRA
jgi:hypothetical protein